MTEDKQGRSCDDFNPPMMEVWCDDSDCVHNLYHDLHRYVCGREENTIQMYKGDGIVFTGAWCASRKPREG